MTRILCTGGAGFIGSTTALMLKHHQVIVVDNFSTGKTENLKHFRGKICPGDITDMEFMDRIFTDFLPEAVLHLAAQSAISTAYSDPQKDMQVNGIGTLNLIKLALKYGVQRFVFSSTSAVYKPPRPFFASVGINEFWPVKPETPYGISKLAAEQYIRTLFPNHLILRYGNVYGPRQKSIGENQVIARAFAHFIHGDDFSIIGHGNQKRDFVYVGDISRCNIAALNSNLVGTFNAASGRSYSVNQVLAEIEKIFDVRGYGWEHTRHNDPRGDVALNVSQIRRKLGWNPDVSLQDGLIATADWWSKKDEQRL